MLREHAASRWDVDVRAGWQLVSFGQDGDGVTSVIADAGTGEQAAVRSRYLVGCDGSAASCARPSGRDSREYPAAAAAAGVPLTVADVAAEDAGGTRDRVRLVLVRPDQRVAWRSRTAPTSQEADDVIAAVTGKSY